MDCESTVHIHLERMLHDASVEPTNLPMSLLKSITNNFSEDQKIGSGGFAVVYKGLLQNGIIAVKKLSRSSEFDERKFIQEVDTMMRVKHKNIVRFLGYCSDTQGKMCKYEGKNVMAEERKRLLCFEFLAKGSLDQYITDASQGLEWKIRYQIIKGICQGLHYLHKQSVLHLDLKPANILLTDFMLPKIADFGLSRCFDGNKSWTMTSKLFGTPGYAAPEFFSGVITFNLDIYSLGVIILEILTGQKGYTAVENVLESWEGRMNTTSQGDAQLEQIRACAEIGIQCIEPDPAKRPDTQLIIVMLEEMERTSGYIGTDQGVPIMGSSVAPKSQPLQRIVSVLPKGPGETRTEIRYIGSSEASKLLDVHPLQLHFPLDENKPTLCPVTLTNRTNHFVGAWIRPIDYRFVNSRDSDDDPLHLRYAYDAWYSGYQSSSRRHLLPVSWEEACSSVFEMVEPHSTSAVTITMLGQQRRWRGRPPPQAGTGKFEVLMIVLRSKKHLELLKASTVGTKIIMDTDCLKRVEELRGEVHQAVLTPDFCDQASCQDVTLNQCRVAWSIGYPGQTKPALDDVSCLDVHPSDTSILVGHIGGYISIWNYKTQERVVVLQVTNLNTSNGSYSVIRSAKFMSREQRIAIGDCDRWVHIYADNTNGKIKEFEAHCGESISLLVVHSTHPFLLTSSFTDTLIKLWDWDQDWMCTQTFYVPSMGLFRLTWNPIDHNTTFVGVSYDKSVKIWDIQSSDPIITFEGMENARYLCSDSHDHLVVIGWDNETDVYNSLCIWDLQSQECIHRLGFSSSDGFDGSDIYDIACHPTLPLFATSHSSGRTICIWETRTYRLERMVQLREGHMQGMVFTGAKDFTRLMAKFWAGILIIEVNLKLQE